MLIFCSWILWVRILDRTLQAGTQILWGSFAHKSSTWPGVPPCAFSRWLSSLPAWQVWGVGLLTWWLRAPSANVLARKVELHHLLGPSLGRHTASHRLCSIGWRSDQPTHIQTQGDKAPPIFRWGSDKSVVRARERWKEHCCGHLFGKCNLMEFKGIPYSHHHGTYWSWLQSEDIMLVLCLPWTITLHIHIFWGSVFLILMFIHYNDHTCHPLAM